MVKFFKKHWEVLSYLIFGVLTTLLNIVLYALFNKLFGYTAANSWQYADGEPKVATPIWKTAMYVAWGVTAVLVIGLEIVAIKRYLNRKKAVATVESAAEPVAAGPANAE